MKKIKHPVLMVKRLVMKTVKRLKAKRPILRINKQRKTLVQLQTLILLLRKTIRLRKTRIRKQEVTKMGPVLGKVVTQHRQWMKKSSLMQAAKKKIKKGICPKMKAKK